MRTRPPLFVFNLKNTRQLKRFQNCTSNLRPRSGFHNRISFLIVIFIITNLKTTQDRYITGFKAMSTIIKKLRTQLFCLNKNQSMQSRSRQTGMVSASFKI